MRSFLFLLSFVVLAELSFGLPQKGTGNTTTTPKCLQMTSKKEKQLKEIVNKITNFVNKLGDEYKALDLSILHIDIDEGRPNQPRSDKTMFKLTVNNCIRKDHQQSDDEGIDYDGDDRERPIIIQQYTINNEEETLSYNTNYEKTEINENTEITNNYYNEQTRNKINKISQQQTTDNQRNSTHNIQQNQTTENKNQSDQTTQDEKNQQKTNITQENKEKQQNQSDHNPQDKTNTTKENEEKPSTAQTEIIKKTQEQSKTNTTKENEGNQSPAQTETSKQTQEQQETDKQSNESNVVALVEFNLAENGKELMELLKKNGIPTSPLIVYELPKDTKAQKRTVKKQVKIPRTQKKRKAIVLKPESDKLKVKVKTYRGPTPTLHRLNLPLSGEQLMDTMSENNKPTLVYIQETDSAKQLIMFKTNTGKN